MLYKAPKGKVQRFGIRHFSELEFLKNYLDGINPKKTDKIVIPKNTAAFAVAQIAREDEFGVYFQDDRRNGKLEESIGSAYFHKKDYFRFLSLIGGTNFESL
jgi:hypothetical protein